MKNAADIEQQAKEWINRNGVDYLRLVAAWRRVSPLTDSQRHTLTAFLSYAHADKNAALRLTADLERRGLQVTSTDQIIAPGQSWAAQLETSIAASDLFLVVVPHQSRPSQWVQAETAIAISASQEGSTHVIPVLLDPDAEIPPLVSHLQALEYFNSKRAELQLDALITSIRSGLFPGQGNSSELEAQLRYVQASREALASDIAAHTSQRAMRCSLIARNTRLLATALLGATGGYLLKSLDDQSQIDNTIRATLALLLGLVEIGLTVPLLAALIQWFGRKVRF